MQMFEGSGSIFRCHMRGPIFYSAGLAWELASKQTVPHGPTATVPGGPCEPRFAQPLWFQRDVCNFLFRGIVSLCNGGVPAGHAAGEHREHGETFPKPEPHIHVPNGLQESPIYYCLNITATHRAVITKIDVE